MAQRNFRLRIFSAGALLLALSAAPSLACDYAHPEGWVQPSTEEILSKSDRTFVGRVIGLRGDDGVVVHERFDDERSNHLISAVLKVEVAIRGVEAGQLIEVTHSIDGGADCGTTYTPGELWLLPGDYFGPMRLKDMPSVEQIAAWRQLPHVPKPVESASASDCRPYTPSREELIEDLRHGNLSFIGTVAGVRREDTTLLTEVPICPAGGGPGASPACQQFWSHIVGVQFAIETGLRGISSGRPYEIRVWPSNLCEAYVPGDHWLLTDWKAGRMPEAPSPRLLKTLRRAARAED